MGHVAFVALMLPSAEFVIFCTHIYISLYTFMPTRPVILSRHFNYEGLYSSHYRYLIYIYVCICRNVRPTAEIIQDQTLFLGSWSNIPAPRSAPWR